jgi:hypothetical protein
MNPQIDYKKKAEKYKQKYLQLKYQQMGGAKEEWLPNFNKELKSIYDAVNGYETTTTVAGSSAILWILENIGRPDMWPEDLGRPSDIDFMYIAKKAAINAPSSITCTKNGTEFTYSRRTDQSSSATSATYELPIDKHSGNFFTAFDLIANSHAPSILLNGVRVLEIRKLQQFYEDAVDDAPDEPARRKKQIKLNIIRDAIEYIKENSELRAIYFPPEAESPEGKMRGPGLFGSLGSFESPERTPPKRLFPDASFESPSKQPSKLPFPDASFRTP